MKAEIAKQKNIEDLKLDFVLTVYEAITKQIQQMDLKISILLSWNGVIAVMMSREVASLFSDKAFKIFPSVTLTLSILAIALSAYYIYRVLKPRVGNMDNNFAGLLFAGDILALGKDGNERMKNYLQYLLAIRSHEDLYQQFSKSIVLISAINVTKNQLFNRALTSTSFSFFALVLLMTLRGLRVQQF